MRSEAAGTEAANDDRDLDWHMAGERLWGIPYTVGSLVDLCFQTMPAAEAGEFTEAAAKAIGVRADLSLVPARFALDLLADDEGSARHGAIRHTTATPDIRAVVERVVAALRRKIAGVDPSEEEWRALIDDAEMACLTVTERCTLAAAAAGYAAFAAAAAHAAFCLDTALTHLGRVLAEAPDAAAYAEFAAWYAPNVRSMDIVDDVAGAVASYGDPPYAYAKRPYPFVGDDPAVAARCANYYRWRAWRLVKHLSESPVGAAPTPATRA